MLLEQAGESCTCVAHATTSLPITRDDRHATEMRDRSGTISINRVAFHTIT
jgi:hypothetical protein